MRRACNKAFTVPPCQQSAGVLLYLCGLCPLGNLSSESNQEDVFLLTPSLPLVNFFLPVRVEGRNCHSDLQYEKKKKSSGLFGKASRLSFSGNYAVQFSSVAQSCPTLGDPMNHSTPGLPVHHQLPEFTQTHIHRVSDAIQPSHPLSSPSPPAPNPSQHQSLFQ